MHRLRRFLRTPKGLLLALLLGLAAAASFGSGGVGRIAPGVAGGMGGAALADILLWRVLRRAWLFPSGALLTGLIVAMVLSPQQPWAVAAATAAVGIGAKYALRVRSANLFNPAALGLVATFYPMHSGQDWWGALPGLPVGALPLLLATGLYITVRVNKLPLLLAFLGGYFFLATVAAFALAPAGVAELFRTPDLQAALYFGFFILTDPPTSPAKHRDQVACGFLVAAVGFGVFELVGAAYFLLAGVLAGNAWEGWRRWSQQRRRAEEERERFRGWPIRDAPV